MAASAAAAAVQQGFSELERQQELIASCTHLWKELTDHFATLERGLALRSDSLRKRRQSLDASARRKLDLLRRRELSIDSSVALAVARVDSLSSSSPASDESSSLRSLSAAMDAAAFWSLLISKRKEIEILKSDLPIALADAIDPPKLVLDAISSVFPVDRRAVKSPLDLGWACVLILESLVPALADPELGSDRSLVTRAVKERAKEMAEEWKGGFEGRGGVDAAKPADVHTFLQLVVTFEITVKEDRELYRKLVICISWRRQTPKLAVSLGLEDRMADIIEELIGKGHQLDAINFAYEAGLEDSFPPVPLLKSFLKDSKKSTSSNSEDHNNTAQSTFNASRKEQSAVRAVMKCIEDHKLEAEFPLEGLQKRLEHLEKAKVEKKKPSSNGPANKRTRANSGGPMPPAKAGRLTNNTYVSSSPVATTFVRSPSAHTTYSATSPSYDRVGAHGVYGSRSPPAIRDPYAYPTEVVAPALGVPYPPPPRNYPAYSGYSNGIGGYNAGLAPSYQQVYYR